MKAWLNSGHQGMSDRVYNVCHEGTSNTTANILHITAIISGAKIDLGSSGSQTMNNHSYVLLSFCLAFLKHNFKILNMKSKEGATWFNIVQTHSICIYPLIYDGVTKYIL